MTKMLVTYHENLIFFCLFKCYNRVPGVSTNPENEQKIKTQYFFFGKPFSASLWKNERVIGGMNRNCCFNDVQFDNIEYFAKTQLTPNVT